jgi:hypothetical protein
MGALVRRVNDPNYAIAKEALTGNGFAMHMEQSGGDEGKVIKTAASNFKVYGISETDTVDKITNAAVAGQQIALIIDGFANVQLSATNAAISVGDSLIAIAGGFVDLYVPTTIRVDSITNTVADVNTRFDEIGHLVGRAEEAKAQNAGGKILTRLQLVSVVDAET